MRLLDIGNLATKSALKIRGSTPVIPTATSRNGGLTRKQGINCYYHAISSNSWQPRFVTMVVTFFIQLHMFYSAVNT